ncbi:uncharacterized protein LOC134241642 [Saccostrea cucullata]|uniref:uncharacterized protein LOC134241642 n=1 Tax=Saccostrea cuccullata TaxID=36930 RepID=UPI002ED60656
MKAVLFLIALLPLAFCAPSEVDKRWLVDLHAVMDQIKHLITPDMEVSTCNTLCKSVVSGLGELVCPTACSTLISTLNG